MRLCTGSARDSRRQVAARPAFLPGPTDPLFACGRDEPARNRGDNNPHGPRLRRGTHTGCNLLGGSADFGTNRGDYRRARTGNVRPTRITDGQLEKEGLGALAVALALAGTA